MKMLSDVSTMPWKWVISDSVVFFEQFQTAASTTCTLYTSSHVYSFIASDSGDFRLSTDGIEPSGCSEKNPIARLAAT